jgi:hypothetical protein
MAVNAEVNWLGQQRVDVPHMRLVESGVRYDFDALSYALVGDAGFIVRGFEVLGSPIGAKANAIIVRAAGSKIIHPLASESGSVFAVPTDRSNEILDSTINARMQGSCQPSSTNYIGIDLKRSADATTADIVQFLDSSENEETPQKVPLRRTLDYVWVVSQVDFTFNRSLIPWAIVTTDDKNAVTAFTDARSLLGRLAPGGSVTTEIIPYGWPGGRPKNEVTATSVIAGDKSLRSLKEWMNGVMTRLWELGGGQYWYSLTADRNVQLHTGATVFTSTGESFEVVSGNLHWKGVSFGFDNSTRFTVDVADQLTDVAGLTDLADGECIYVDLDRSTVSTIWAQKGSLTSLGGSSRPGQRWVIASRIGSSYYVSGQPWPVGGSSSIATVAHYGMIRTNLDADTPAPVAASIDTSTDGIQGSVTGAGVSRNTDIGSARLYNSAGDLQIGRGEDAGDQDIKIVTDGQRSTMVMGQGDEDYPILQVVRGGGTYGNSPQSGFTPGCTPFDLGNGIAQFEGGHAWSLKSIMYLPVRPTLSNALVLPRVSQVKYFLKQNKVWKYPVVWMACSLDGFTWTWNGTTKTLTRTDTGELVFDVANSPSLADRVLINVDGFAYNGIYTVSNLGGGSEYAELTLDIDSGGVGSVEALGLGFDIFDGSAVRITSGDHYGGMCAVMDAPAIAQTVDQSVYLWRSTDSTTVDEYCVMWEDGSYTTLASGPEYDGLSS